MPASPADISFLKRALELAAKGLSTVSPNPAVGAVIVKNCQVIGEGWHERAGEPHAERIAFANLTESAEGATIYVTLEPCSHTGRTPPCTEAIIENKIARVVVCMQDPNPVVSGTGFQQLRDAGIEVDFGYLEAEAEQLNEVYLHNRMHQRPFVHVKAGTSLDGKIATATGRSKWITSEESRTYAHQLRERYDAILIGTNTLLSDDPSLNVRMGSEGAIARIILDTDLRIPLDAKVLQVDSGAQLFIVSGNDSDIDKRKQLLSLGVELIECNLTDNKIDLADLMDALYEKQIMSLLVEGGGETIASFLAAGLVQKVSFIYAPMIIGGKGSVPVVAGADIDELTEAVRLKELQTRTCGPDIIVEGRIT